jgi:hypothetical protein
LSILLKIKNDLSNLPDLITLYDAEVEQAEQNLMLEGKNLVTANSEQPMWYHHYNKLLQQLKIAQKFVDNKLDAKKGSLWIQFKENHSRALAATDISHYIENEKSYADIKTMALVVGEMVGEMEVLVKAFEQRGYTLRNLTELRVHELQNTII